MNALAYRPTVTVVDVLDAGACISGVMDFIEEHTGGVIAGDTAKLLRTSDASGRNWITRASNADGYGYGYGYGDGDGDGDGYGDGYGEDED